MCYLVLICLNLFCYCCVQRIHSVWFLLLSEVNFMSQDIVYYCWCMPCCISKLEPAGEWHHSSVSLLIFCSIKCLERNVELSIINHGCINFSFRFYQILFHIFIHNIFKSIFANLYILISVFRYLIVNMLIDSIWCVRTTVLFLLFACSQVFFLSVSCLEHLLKFNFDKSVVFSLCHFV